MIDTTSADSSLTQRLAPVDPGRLSRFSLYEQRDLSHWEHYALQRNLVAVRHC